MVGKLFRTIKNTTHRLRPVPAMRLRVRDGQATRQYGLLKLPQPFAGDLSQHF
jgi:hypothetical protein